MNKGNAAKTDTMAPESKSTETGAGKPKADSNTGAAAEGNVGSDAEDKAGATAKGEADTKGKAGATVEGKAGKSVKLESEQVGKVKTYFSQNKPSVTVIEKNEISVSVGVALPGTVVLYDLPPDIIVVQGVCPIKYFVWGDDIVLVDSCSRQVVEILVGVA